MSRQMVLVGFLQAQNCTHLAFSWRHPESRTDFLSADFYQEIARILERGKFHLAFFDDRLALPDRLGGDHVHAIENGIRCVKMDPIPVLMAMAAVTTKLGLGATCSATYYEPFHVARLFSTIDHMTGGRAAWNVVTSLNDGEAMNMGRDGVMQHDLRYDRADEFMEVVTGHWDSWQDGALIVDKENARFGDGSKVSRLDHKGKWFNSRGPFTVPRTPQGHPVVIQAGQSGRGRRFAGRWGEVIFATAGNLEAGQKTYASIKEEAVRAGRDPDAISICLASTSVVAPTRAEAEDRMALLEKLPREIDVLSLLSEGLNFDFASKPRDEPFTSEELAGFSGLLAIRDQVLTASGKANPSVDDFLRYSHRSRPTNAVVGDPKQVADHLEALFTGRACDGFVVSATHVPGAYSDFVDLVVPELQRRGVYHTDYAGTTLRENLGLPRAPLGSLK